MQKEDPTGTLRLTGRVVDDQKRPVRDALVRIDPGERSVSTDVEGTFEFDGLAPRRYRLTATKDEFYAGPLMTRASESSEAVELQLHRGATLVVHVTANGARIAGARVVVDQVLTDTTNVDGTATIRGLSPEYHDGWVMADGWAPAFLHSFSHEDPGGVIERFVSLQPGARIEGSVLGPDDAPVPEATIVLWGAADGRYISGATSASDGSWSIDALAAGKFRVNVTSEHFGGAEPVILESDGVTPQRGVVLRVEEGAQVFGAVLDKSGNPAPGAQVRAMLYHAGSKRTVADANGRFRIAGLKPGEYYVEAVAPLHASEAAHLHLERGKPVEIQLVLEPSRVAGIVVDQRGEPVVEATVRANACTGYVPYRLEVQTDSRGHFDLGPLQVGEYDLNARWPGAQEGHGSSSTTRVRNDDSQIRIVLEAPSRITGRVLLDGAPLQYFGADLVRDNEIAGGRAIGIRDADGRFTLHAEPGKWRVALMGQSTKLKIVGDISVKQHELLDIGDILMERGQRIAGHVRDVHGATVEGARVKIDRGIDLHEGVSKVRRWFHGQYETTTDADGAYVFDGVGQPEFMRAPPFISALHHARGASPVQLLPENDATVDFVLIGSGAINGLVQGAQGRHRFIQAVAAGEPERARWMGTNKAGEFRFDDVPAGEYVVTLSGEDDELSTSETVLVVAGQRSKVTLVMMKRSTVELTIRVPRGREGDLRIERVDVPNQVSRRSMRMTGQITFREVHPGRYRVSLDGTSWTEFEVVLADPPKQTVDLTKS